MNPVNKLRLPLAVLAVITLMTMSFTAGRMHETGRSLLQPAAVAAEAFPSFAYLTDEAPVSIAATAMEEPPAPRRNAVTAVSSRPTAASGTVFTCRVHPDLPEYRFHLVLGEDSNSAPVQCIVIRPRGAPEAAQVLETGLLFPAEGNVGPAGRFGFQDVDFDGYTDIRLTACVGVTGNTGYHYWLYDPLQRKFVYRRENVTYPGP